MTTVLARHRQAEHGAAPWTATAYLLTSAISTLVLGKLGDMYGRKPVFQFSIVVFLAGSALCGTATACCCWRCSEVCKASAAAD
jgi:MFS family permease